MKEILDYFLQVYDPHKSCLISTPGKCQEINDDIRTSSFGIPLWKSRWVHLLFSPWSIPCMKPALSPRSGNLSKNPFHKSAVKSFLNGWARYDERGHIVKITQRPSFSSFPQLSNFFLFFEKPWESNLKETFIFICKNILRHINSVLGCPLFLNDEPELIHVCS